MTFGAEFYNDVGTLQIATGISNYYLVESGSVTLTTAINFTISPTVSYDIIAINANCHCVPKTIFPDTQTSGAKNFRKNSAVTGTCNWWAFRSYKALTPATSGYGMEIYNPDGTVGFSTTQPKILRSYQKIPITNSALFSTSLPSGKVFAFIQYGVTTKYSTGSLMGETFDIFLGPTLNYSAGNVDIQVDQRIGRATVSTVYAGGLLAVDVTGY